MLYWIRIVVFEDGLIVCGNEPYMYNLSNYYKSQTQLSVKYK